MRTKGIKTSEEHKKYALEAITQFHLTSVLDIISYVPYSNFTFYDRKLHEDPDIREALNKEKVKIKNGLKEKWYRSENNVAGQIFLYKLLATQEELEKIDPRYKANQEQGTIELPQLNLILET